MPQQRISEIEESLFDLERRIKPLEWDASRNQINEFKLQQLAKLKDQHRQLKEELQSLMQ